MNDEAFAIDSKTCIVCSKCGGATGTRYESRCPCGGVWAPKYRNSLSWSDSEGAFGARFAHILPLDDLSTCREQHSLRTPLRDAGPIGRKYGVPNLALKLEVDLPTRTTKARMAAVALSYLLERGVSRFVVTSTGNSTTAMARLMPLYPELEMFAFAGRDFARRHREMQQANITFMSQDGDFVDAERAAKRFAEENRITIEGGFFNPARRIGLATAYLEAWAALPRAPDWYFQAVSSGMGVVAVGELGSALVPKGRRSLPKLIPVQQETCAPMVRAWVDGAESIRPEYIVKDPHGIAEAILRGDPSSSYPIVRRWILESGGHFMAVSEENILFAIRLLREELDIRASASGATALAGAIKAGEQGLFGSDDIVLVNVTGAETNGEPG